MHFKTTLFTLALALTGTTLALPANRLNPTPSATPAVALAPTPTPNPVDDTRDWPKFTSNPSATGPDHEQDGKADGTSEDRCSSLCAVVAEACVVAVPNDEAFW